MALDGLKSPSGWRHDNNPQAAVTPHPLRGVTLTPRDHPSPRWSVSGSRFSFHRADHDFPLFSFVVLCSSPPLERKPPGPGHPCLPVRTAPSTASTQHVCDEWMHQFITTCQAQHTAFSKLALPKTNRTLASLVILNFPVATFKKNVRSSR